jgi:hypothetical protein
MIQKPGRAGYWCDFYAGGRRIQKKLSNDYQAACRILNLLRARADEAEFGRVNNELPVAELKDAYLRYLAQARPRSCRRYEHSLDVALDSLGATQVSHIDTEGILKFRQERLAESASPRTVNHDVTILGAMLNWGVRNRMIGHNPIKGLAPLRHDNPKDGRPLTPDERSGD